MQTSANVIEEHQNRKRYVVFLHAKYLLKPREETGECVVVNITSNGACIMFPHEAVFAKGDALSLKIKTKGSEIVTATGNFVWCKKMETAWVTGVEFSKPLNIYSLIKNIFI